MNRIYFILIGVLIVFVANYAIGKRDHAELLKMLESQFPVASQKFGAWAKDRETVMGMIGHSVTELPSYQDELREMEK